MPLDGRRVPWRVRSQHNALVQRGACAAAAAADAAGSGPPFGPGSRWGMALP
jgi:hypothetical protein